jgi:hypothetical protein
MIRLLRNVAVIVVSAAGVPRSNAVTIDGPARVFAAEARAMIRPLREKLLCKATVCRKSPWETPQLLERAQEIAARGND